jgi:GTP-binding protein
MDGSDPVVNYRTIRRELELYRPALAAKPEITAVSKAELTGSGDVRARLQKELGRPVFAISAVTGQGLSDLVNAVAGQLRNLPQTSDNGAAAPSDPTAEGAPAGEVVS